MFSLALENESINQHMDQCVIGNMDWLLVIKLVKRAVPKAFQVAREMIEIIVMVVVINAISGVSHKTLLKLIIQREWTVMTGK